jgi:hypothetical protein
MPRIISNVAAWGWVLVTPRARGDWIAFIIVYSQNRARLQAKVPHGLLDEFAIYYRCLTRGGSQRSIHGLAWISNCDRKGYMPEFAVVLEDGDRHHPACRHLNSFLA